MTKQDLVVGQRFMRAGLVYVVREADSDYVMFSVEGFEHYRCISRRQWDRLMVHGSALAQVAA